MKQTILTTSLSLLMCFSIYGQNITLTDLTNLCNKKNWENINQVLLSKGWTYYDSEKGNTYKYNTITWSYNKEYYSDKAQAWFYLYTFDGYPNKISYSIYNKESYSKIQNSLTTAGFKLLNSEIENNEVISTYGNAMYILKISTEKRYDEKWKDRSLTAYNITIIKKAGIYDPDNGKKKEYYYGDVIKAEYTLSNGEINGEIKVYHENGKIKKIGNYKHGLEDGNFKEYDDDGNLSSEYAMANGNKNGVFKTYEDGKIKILITYKDNIKNGLNINYYYDDETGELIIKNIGEYINGEKNGTWKLYYIEEGKERLLQFENFNKGVLNGGFQQIYDDSLIIGSYKNGVLNGEYKVYRDLVKILLGGMINTDINTISLVCEGYFYNGQENGEWKYYSLDGTLISNGSFLSGKKTGEWKYYYTNFSNGEGLKLAYSKELYLVENYSNGKLNGKSTRYSYLEEEKYPCSETYEHKSSLDTCERHFYIKVLMTSFYKNDKLNGPFELLDSMNDMFSKGFYIDDLKDGEWTERLRNIDENNSVYFTYQKGEYIKDKRNGKWTQYNNEGKIYATLNYKNDVLHGDYIVWNEQNKPKEIKLFNFGKLKELTTYDSLGLYPKNKYEIYDEKNFSYKCRKTEYFDNGYSTQEYWLMKNEDIDHHWFEFNFISTVYNLLKYQDKPLVGYKDGKFEVFNSENKLVVTGNYFKEEANGLWTFYYYDQGVKIEYEYSENDKTNEKYYTLIGEPFSGKFIYNDSKNETKEERKIKDGLRNGKTTFYDINTNKILKKEKYKNGGLK